MIDRFVGRHIIWTASSFAERLEVVESWWIYNLMTSSLTCCWRIHTNYYNLSSLAAKPGYLSIYLSKRSRLWRRRCRSTTRAPNKL